MKTFIKENWFKTSVLFSLILISPIIVSARSGCCSHHQGVRPDGCGCNDGTSLSATCAPYYSCTADKPKTPVNTGYITPAPATEYKPPVNSVINTASVVASTKIEEKKVSWFTRFINWFKQI